LSLLIEQIQLHQNLAHKGDKKLLLLSQKAMMLIKALRTKDISLPHLVSELGEEANNSDFNLYRFIEKYRIY
jgi:hypothetical protein